MTSSDSVDVLVIGGGIVGLATAYQMTQTHPHKSIVVLEKESELAQHQTGRNSGVLHSGIYYKPGSLKAQNCRDGRRAMIAFCEQHDIDYDICGKVIVAVSDDEVPTLENIYQRGQANGVTCERIAPERLHELEPHVAGVQAIHVPEAGIVNFREVANRLGELISSHGGSVVTNAKVTGIETRSDMVVVESTAGTFQARFVVNCGGLHSDRLTRLAGQQPAARIIPFRGEYYELKLDVFHLCRNLIYPVPNPNFPFLGVHFTRMIEGGVECGPNAVFAFAREGYLKRNVNITDLTSSLSYPGFLKLAARYWRMGAGEMWRSFSKRAFVRALQRLVPEIRSKDLLPGRAGVRAQAVAADGSMVDDFLIQKADRILHVGNAPSPAATASLNIGKTILAQYTTATE